MTVNKNNKRLIWWKKLLVHPAFGFCVFATTFSTLYACSVNNQIEQTANSHNDQIEEKNHRLDELEKTIKLHLKNFDIHHSNHSHPEYLNSLENIQSALVEFKHHSHNKDLTQYLLEEILNQIIKIRRNSRKELILHDKNIEPNLIYLLLSINHDRKNYIDNKSSGSSSDFFSGGAFALALFAGLIAFATFFVSYLSSISKKTLEENLDDKFELKTEDFQKRSHLRSILATAASITDQAIIWYSDYKQVRNIINPILPKKSNNDIDIDRTPKPLLIDLHQNYSQLTTAIKLTYSALSRTNHIYQNLQSIKTKEREALESSLEKLQPYVLTNLAYFYCEFIEDKCKFSLKPLNLCDEASIRQSAKSLISEAIPKVEKLYQNDSNWPHIKESEIHVLYFLHPERYTRNTTLNNEMKLEVQRILKYNTDTTDQQWFNEIEEKWNALLGNIWVLKIPVYAKA